MYYSSHVTQLTTANATPSVSSTYIIQTINSNVIAVVAAAAAATWHIMLRPIPVPTEVVETGTGARTEQIQSGPNPYGTIAYQLDA